MAGRINQRTSLFTSGSVADRPAGGAPSQAEAVRTAPLVNIGDTGAHHGRHAEKVAALSATADEPTDTPRTFTLPGKDWGLGFGNLTAVQDQETAFVVMADGTITVVTSGGGGYQVRSGFPTDGYFVSHLFQDAAVQAVDYNELRFDFSDRKQIILQSGQTAFSVQGKAGDVFGTAAAETITGSAGDDIVHGGNGADNIMGAVGNDIAWGGAGNDAISGNDGVDNVNGGAGNDTVDGGAGDDLVTGGGGADSLLGSEGADLLLGGDGADELDGGAGADTLLAGLGADKVTGGEGADVFMFTEGDSGAGVTQLDTVNDFEVGVDKMDLTGFLEQLDVVQAFTHHAYEMIFEDSDTGTTVRVDTNGDGTADQEINVIVKDEGGHLTIDDFIV
jgi:Ca2+-binding RTX toxin-like protein